MTLCGAHKKRGGTCTQAAGWGTVHPGRGRCKLHGGASAGRPIEHGRYSLAHRQALADKQRAFLSDPEPGNLAGEVALMRALLQEYLERYPAGVNPTEKTLVTIMGMVDQIGKMVERIAKIETTTALTQAEVQLLQARFAEIIVRYVDDPAKRSQLMDELEAAALAPGGAGDSHARRAGHTTIEG